LKTSGTKIVFKDILRGIFDFKKYFAQGILDLFPYEIKNFKPTSSEDLG
jgi:hypothetical protein